MTNTNSARVFHDLHQNGLLILPNAWDAGSARIVEHAGAKAIATSSAAVAWANGYPDGEAVPPEVLLSTVHEIVRIVGIPVSADVEAGYAADPVAAGAFAARVVDAGAVGVNIEDGNDAPDLLSKKIERMKEAASKAGVDLWINARTDIYLRHLMEGDAAYAETVRRAGRYREAGADSFFVPAVVQTSLIRRLVDDVVLPLNLLAWPGLPDAASLRDLGVRRLSAGSGIAKAVVNQTHELARAFLADGRSETFGEGALTNPEINRLMRRA